MKVIVTGHTGTIGSHLSDRCIKSRVRLQNVSDTMDEEKLYSGSTVIHLAGIVGLTNVKQDPIESFKVNVTNTIEFAERSLEAGVSKFVFASTCHVYGKSNTPISEDHFVEPQNLYAEQKLRAEIALENLFLRSDSQLSIIRVFSVLDWDCKDFTLGGLFRRIAGDDKNLLIHNGDDERDFLTPKSIAGTLERLASEEGLSGIWNLSSGNALTVRDAAFRMLSDVIGQSLSDRIIPGRSDLPRVVGDNQKLYDALPDLELNWNPGSYRQA
jgi:nucleoside-diphosphate-sugar epimerase